MNRTSHRFLNKNWLSEFNLYKYESTSQKKPTKYPLRVFYTLGMILVISFIVCLVIVQSTNVSNIPIENSSNVTEESFTEKISTQMKRGVFLENEDTIIKIPHTNILTTQHFRRNEPLKPLKQHSDSKETLINNNLTENLPTNETEYLLEREDSQPINLRHPRQRKVKFPQPRNQRNEVNGITMPGIRDQIPRPPRSRKISTRRHLLDDVDHPRPFNFLLDGPLPSQFRKNKKLQPYPQDFTANVDNIQDILQRVPDPQERNINPRNFATIQIAGKYRHLKGNGITRLFNTGADNQQSTREDTILKHEIYGDPFYPYKPRSPGEINLLASNQFRFVKQPSFRNSGLSRSVYQQSHTPDLENMYSKIITASNYRQRDQNNSRAGTSNKLNKPLSLMLDIYQMHDENPSHMSTSYRPQKKKRKPHFLPPQGSSAINNLPYSFQLDNSYYNSINFPQVQQSKFPAVNSFYHNAYFHNQHPEEENSLHGGLYQNAVGESKPSQIMVQLNLFPKRKDRNKNGKGKFDVISTVIDDRISDASETHNSVIINDTTNNVTEVDYNAKELPDQKTASNEVVAKGININQELPRIVTLSAMNKSSVKSSEPSVNFKISDTDVIKFEYGDGLDGRNNKFY